MRLKRLEFLACFSLDSLPLSILIYQFPITSANMNIHNMKYGSICLLLFIAITSCVTNARKEMRYFRRIMFKDKDLSNWTQQDARYKKIYIDSFLMFRPTLYPDQFFSGTQDTFFIEGKTYATKPIQLKIPRKWQKVKKNFPWQYRVCFDKR